MRDDPQDLQDALFIVRAAGLTQRDIEQAVRDARLLPVPEVAEQFHAATERLYRRLSATGGSAY